MRASHGFTLIELLVVIALIAIGTAAVSFSLRDSAQNCARARCRAIGHLV
jgi:prepilin-type N-terminal cleavage/methylation domain-containing protein